ncbi:MAG: DUF441 family protein [Clostridium sp.]
MIIIINYIFLCGIVILSIITKNRAFAIGTGLCIILSIFNSKDLDNFIEKHFLNLGMIILTIWMIYPIIKGNELSFKAILTPIGIIGFMAGILAAILASKGLVFSKGSVDVVTGVVLGTIVGVSLFKGVAIGPLIASGIAFIVYRILEMIRSFFI